LNYCVDKHQDPGRFSTTVHQVVRGATGIETEVIDNVSAGLVTHAA
jgi:hypothetical protein